MPSSPSPSPHAAEPTPAEPDTVQTLRDVPVAGVTPDEPNALRREVIDEALARAREQNKKPRFRTIFISDLHLGFKGAQASEVVRLLKLVKCDKLYLVGDVIDGWRLKSRWYWPAEHNEVIRRVLKMARKGTEVIYIPGNHDEVARQFCRLEFGGVKIKLYDIHETEDGKRYFVTHGDQFDLVIKHSRALSMLGALAYEWLVRINILYNRCRAFFGLRYWSLSHFLKMRVKKACTFISRFEEAVVEEARRRELDGVVCGHIHKAERADFDGVQYVNCGDWVESCTLAVEDMRGRVVVMNGDELIGVAPTGKMRRKARAKAQVKANVRQRDAQAAMVRQTVPSELDPRQAPAAAAGAGAGADGANGETARGGMDPEIASMVKAVAHAHDDPESVMATATRWLEEDHDDHDEWREEDWDWPGSSARHHPTADNGTHHGGNTGASNHGATSNGAAGGRRGAEGNAAGTTGTTAADRAARSATDSVCSPDAPEAHAGPKASAASNGAATASEDMRR